MLVSCSDSKRGWYREAKVFYDDYSMEPCIVVSVNKGRDVVYAWKMPVASSTCNSIDSLKKIADSTMNNIVNLEKCAESDK